MIKKAFESADSLMSLRLFFPSLLGMPQEVCSG